MHDEIVDEIISSLYDACANLDLVAAAADSIASGSAANPEKLANSIRQAAWALAEALGRHIDLLEISARQQPDMTEREAAS